MNSLLTTKEQEDFLKKQALYVIYKISFAFTLYSKETILENIKDIQNDLQTIVNELKGKEDEATNTRMD